MSAPHVVSVEGDHRLVLMVPGRLWVCNCGWVSDQALGEALWLLLQARWYAEQMHHYGARFSSYFPWEDLGSEINAARWGLSGHLYYEEPRNVEETHE